MQKVKKIVVPRGPRQNTLFPINGNKTIQMKALYKAFTNPQLYADRLGHNNVEVCTKVAESPFLLIENKIGVDTSGQCKMRANVVWEDGTQQRICVQFQINTTVKKITVADIDQILDLFFQKLNVPELA